MCQPLSHLFLIDSVESSLISPVSFSHLLFLIVSVVSSVIPSVTQCYSSPSLFLPHYLRHPSLFLSQFTIPCGISSSSLSSTHLSLSLSLVISCHITCPYHHHQYSVGFSLLALSLSSVSGSVIITQLFSSLLSHSDHSLPQFLRSFSSVHSFTQIIHAVIHSLRSTVQSFTQIIHSLHSLTSFSSIGSVEQLVSGLVGCVGLYVRSVSWCGWGVVGVVD